MDAATHRLLESVTHSTLHATAFARSSTQATHVLTDLLARYLALLTASCRGYAEHAGRPGITVHDALAALDEMGTNMEELRDFCRTDGNDLARYAMHSARRMEDMKAIQATLAEGLRTDRDDFTPLVFAPILDGWDDDDDMLMEQAEEEFEVEQTQESDFDMVDPEVGKEDWSMQIVAAQPELEEPSEQGIPPLLIRTNPSTLRPPAEPPLPLSPISNPSSPEPPRKRPRTASWRPPDHIPDFLPPLPIVESQLLPPSPTADPANSAGPSGSGLPKTDAAPTTAPAPDAQPAAAQLTGASDYHTRVPYALSSLSSVPSWTLPRAPSPPPPPTLDAASVPHPALLTPQAPNTPHPHPSLLGAYHHLLTHPPDPTIPPRNTNPARHRMAMALLAQSALRPQYDPADSLFGASASNAPRYGVVPPFYPKPVKDGDKEVFPPHPMKSLVHTERVVPLVSRQSSRLPHIAQMILPPAVHKRATSMSHPQPLVRNPNAERPERLTYGEGIPAPWNVVPLGAATQGGDGKGKAGNANGDSNAGDGTESPLTNARLYATWDTQRKDYRGSLNGNIPGGKLRQGSMSVGPPSALLRLGLQSKAHGKSG